MRRQTELAGMRAILALLALQVCWPVQADTQPAPTRWTFDWYFLSPLLVLFVVTAVTAALLRYMWSLRDQVSRTLVNGRIDDRMRMAAMRGYSDWPLGLPRGSVRAVWALMIVFGSLALLAISTALPQVYKFPDALVGILGAVLGFYFGKNGGSTDGQVIAAVAAAHADARDAIKQTSTAQSGTRDAQAQAAAANEALQDAGKIVDQAAPNLPVVSVLAKAVQAIGPVLGGAISPIALINTLIGVGSKLGAAAYAHWIARIMDRPYTPEQFSPKFFDSNAAISVMTQVPTLLEVFRPQLAAGGRAIALDVVQRAFAPDGSEELVNKYPQAFAGLAQPLIESAVRDLQKAALDYVLGQEVPPDAAQDVGGLAALLKAVDQVRGNSEASAALDLVMTTAKTLKSNQMHPELVFTNAASLLSSSNTATTA